MKDNVLLSIAVALVSSLSGLIVLNLLTDVNIKMDFFLFIIISVLVFSEFSKRLKSKEKYNDTMDKLNQRGKYAPKKMENTFKNN